MVDNTGADGRAVGDLSTPHVLLMTRADCHLCDDARQVVLDTAEPAGASWSDHDVDADPELRAEFGDRVPVVLVAPARPGGASVDTLLDGAVEVAYFRVTSAVLAGAIDRARAHRPVPSHELG